MARPGAGPSPGAWSTTNAMGCSPLTNRFLASKRRLQHSPPAPFFPLHPQSGPHQAPFPPSAAALRSPIYLLLPALKPIAPLERSQPLINFAPSPSSMASAVMAPAPIRRAFPNLRVEIPDLCAPSPLPTPGPAPAARATLRPLRDDEGETGPSSETLGRRAQLLGTRAGTPRRARIVRFAVARDPMPACLAYQGLRSATLGSTCGTPRSRAPLVHFTPCGPGRAHSLGPNQARLAHRRDTVLGSRRGSPRRGRTLVSFTSLPEGTAAGSLAQGTPAALSTVGAPRDSQGPWEQYEASVALASARAQAVSSGSSPEARRDLLGSRQGTPRRQKQLGRTSSDALQWDILTL